MNILFLSLGKFSSLNEQNIYTDLLRCFVKNSDKVYAVSLKERRDQREMVFNKENGAELIRVKSLNIQKTSILEKGIATLLLTGKYKKAIKKHFSDIKFDLILYPTPPITLYGVVKYFKKRDSAKTYLMLKDIFPQNAVDIGLMKTTGLKGLIYKYFRKQEKNLYAVSDKIGCMSPANVDYILNHNPEIRKEKVEVLPNCVDIKKNSLSKEEKKQIRIKYELPLNKKIFVYGGNLGKPQGIPFIIDCLKAEKDNEEVFFLIIGDGTEYSKLEQYSNESRQNNFKLLKRLPSDDYNHVVASCDVGLIFLDHRFTIPNFPSRILSYMQVELPILACTDLSTDMGKIIEDNYFGCWCESNDVEGFSKTVKKICSCNLRELGINAKHYLIENYSSEVAFRILKDGLQ